MTAARYDQCDQTCTVDCGHCKGDGPPPPHRVPQVGDKVVFVGTLGPLPLDAERAWERRRIAVSTVTVGASPGYWISAVDLAGEAWCARTHEVRIIDLPSAGGAYRFTVDGVVTCVDDHGTCVIRPAGISGPGAEVPAGVGTWERLPDPEPQWEPGDAVNDRFGHAHIRAYGGTWIDPDGDRILDSKMARPLTRLVPEVTR